MVTADVVPNGLVMGPRGALEGLNLIGLKRRGVARSDIAALRAAFDVLKSGEGTVQDKVQQIGSEHQSETVRLLIEFVMAGGDRGLLMPR